MASNRQTRFLLIGTIASALLISASVTFAADGPKIEFNTANAVPREIEETTEQAILREYSAAWKALATALKDNRSDQLAATFVGPARQAIAQQVEQQRKSGLSVRLVDRGHQLQAVFYSPEGSAMQLRDVVQLEKQYLDGDQVVHTEQLTQNYVVLMAVTEDRWKVRLLQEVE
jgi:hypothetical protein